MGLEALLGKLDERADLRGREFERVCKWFLCNAPEYRGQLRQVWLWDEWPGRWAADAGIDLVAEAVDGTVWAIQAKAYDPAYAIKKADVDSFLSESARPEFSYRLLIATTDRIGHTARRTLAGQEKPAGVLLRSQLALAEVRWPASPADLRPRPAAKKRPRRHQRKAVAAVVRGFGSTDRGQLVMACGTGKTLAACFLAEALAARRVLVLVPSLSLLAQTLREWALAGEFSYLAVCSDETVTGDATDAVVASTSELGFPVTTDPAVLARFLRGRGHRMRVVFATYQSSPRIAEAQASRSPAFDLVIADEAHRCAGPEAGIFATVLDAAKIKARKRLFMTATPRYFTGRLRKEASETDWEIASMDDEQKFGPVLHRLSFAQAIDKDLLSDYQVVVVGVTDRSFREMAERGAFVTTDGQTITDARTLARQIGLLRAMRNHDLHRVVSFHSRISNARRFATSILEVTDWMPRDLAPDGALWAEHVSGEMSSGERDVRLNRLRAVAGGERGLLTNARCLSEGVDVPSLDGVAFIDPRRSQVDIVQAVGRAIRTAEGKTVGTIVIPVFVDETADPEQALDSSEFSLVWEVVKALRAHDEVLADELDELRRELGRRLTSSGRPTKIHFDLPVGVGNAFARAFDTKLVETSTANWEFWYGLLQTYVAHYGHGSPAADHMENGFTLGGWVSKQRDKYSAGRLSEEHIRRLESLSKWSWDRFADRWEQGLAHLREYALKERHTRMPRSYKESDDFPLGSWVFIQRRARQLGTLPIDRQEKLEGVPGWTWFTKPWEEHFAILEAYVAREGTAGVPKNHVEGGFSLGHWCLRQKISQRGGKLSAAHVSALAALPGWEWSTGPRMQRPNFTEGVEALVRFLSCHSWDELNARLEVDGFRLGQWVTVQRYSHNTGKMNPERARVLQSIPGWVWDMHESAWDRNFRLLTRYVEREVVASGVDRGRR